MRKSNEKLSSEGVLLNHCFPEHMEHEKIPLNVSSYLVALHILQVLQYFTVTPRQHIPGVYYARCTPLFLTPLALKRLLAAL